VTAPVTAPASTRSAHDAAGSASGALVGLDALMARTSGSSSVRVGVLDGPVCTSHPALAGAGIWPAEGYAGVACTNDRTAACAHGTFIAGILVAARGSPAPGICPGCTLLVRPIFEDATTAGRAPAASADELARAVEECVRARAHVLNVSAATGRPSTRTEQRLHASLDDAARRGVLVVAAAGNQGTLGSSAITRHPWVIPVAACDRHGRPTRESNLGSSIGRRGLGAPGDAVPGLDVDGGARTGGGTSVAAAFVTGTIALLCSLFPRASATAVKRAVTGGGRRTAVTPPMLDAGAALRAMEM
jgi:subtilisin family serine protease